jgi:transmembrane sensor
MADADTPVSPSGSGSAAEQASLWLARRDRGLSAAEQDDYLRWLQASPEHAAAVAQQAAALERMMRLYEWQPSHTAEPNPALFAPAAAPRRPWRLAAAVGLAAALVAGFFAVFGPDDPSPVPSSSSRSYLKVNERLALPDGSRAELRDGSAVVVQYSETERRVRLTGGEAHFTVWKDPARPFVVEAGGVSVRAVGTAFAVRLGAKEVEVLVTEGRVDVSAGPSARPSAAGGAEVPRVSAGERATVARPALPAAVPDRPVIVPVTNDDIRRELAWQTPRLEFDETPLADAVAEFNRLNRQQLALADPKLGTLRIGGTFRPDNVEGFVRLLAETHGLRAGPDAEGRLVLRTVR